MPDQSSDSVIASIQVFYEGNVQGVGFRYSVRQIAKGFDVTGSVRNLRDGRVELLATGEEDEVRAFWKPSGKASCALISRSSPKRRLPIRLPSAASKSGMTEPAVAVTGVTKVFPVPFQRRSVVAVRDLNLKSPPAKSTGCSGRTAPARAPR